MSPELKSLKIYPCYSGCTYDAGPVCMASNDFMGGPCAGYQLHCEPVAIYTMRRPGTLANEGLLSRFISVCHVSLGRQAVVFSRWHSQLQQFQGEVSLGPAPPLPAPPRPPSNPWRRFNSGLRFYLQAYLKRLRSHFLAVLHLDCIKSPA